jgi:uncharacterized membrane protein YbhN (UPF0104 family)
MAIEPTSSTPAGASDAAGAQRLPRLAGTHGGRRRILLTTAAIVGLLAGLYFLLPQLAGINKTWGRLRHGDPVWLAVAAAVELLSIGGYALVFRTVFGRGVARLGWLASIEIPLAGIAAIRLLAAAGAGSVAVTVWALERAGMERRVVACRMIAAIFIQYGAFLGAVLIFGLGVGFGVMPGQGPFELTILPAILSVIVAAAVMSAVALPHDVERRLGRVAGGARWWGRVVERVAAAPAALGDGARTAARLVLVDRRPGLIGAVLYWGFDIAALGFSFAAFGGHPPVGVIVLGYFLGQLGSLLPLPGGIGGVEGAMIGSFVAFGVSADQAIVAVLAYRAISFWLPTLPGIAGYLLLRRRVSGWQRAGADASRDAPGAATAS